MNLFKWILIYHIGWTACAASFVWSPPDTAWIRFEAALFIGALWLLGTAAYLVLDVMSKSRSSPPKTREEQE